MKKWKKLMIGLVCLLIIAAAGTAYAGTILQYYAVDITWLSSDRSDYQTKTTTGSAAYQTNYAIENDVTLICRMYDADGHKGDRTFFFAGWDGYIDASTEHTSGEKVYLQFAVNLGSLETITATGKWQSN
jgi:hypothetical protein